MSWQEEMDAIAARQKGIYNPDRILKIVQARPEKYPSLYGMLEWQDTIAADKYRREQVQRLIQVRVTYLEAGDIRYRVRALVNIDRGTSNYLSIVSVLSSEEQKARLLALALRELESFREKYAALEALAPVFEAINSAVKIKKQRQAG